MNNINAGFIGDFRLGDNINYNLGILKILYEKDEEENEYSLNKPIIITIVSIIEGLLRDFFFKATYYTKESISNIRKEVLTNIRKGKANNFYAYIEAAKKYDIFNIKEQDLYGNLDTLRKLRNRIHIQNEKNNFAPDEERAFSTEKKVLAEQVLERIMRLMSSKHNRGHDYVSNFSLPWSPHHFAS